MTFTSWQFGVFAAIVFAAYYLPALRGFQVQLLVFASLFFYGSGQPELLALLGLRALPVEGNHLAQFPQFVRCDAFRSQARSRRFKREPELIQTDYIAGVKGWEEDAGVALSTAYR